MNDFNNSEEYYEYNEVIPAEDEHRWAADF
jgi:hypothetical protein